jgi:hypothetical protein
MGAPHLLSMHSTLSLGFGDMDADGGVSMIGER